MKLNRLDTVVFRNASGTEKVGSAIRFDPKRGLVWVRVPGPQFRWQGGPPGESLDHNGNLRPGQIAYSDSVWVTPITHIVRIEPRKRSEGNAVGA